MFRTEYIGNDRVRVTVPLGPTQSETTEMTIEDMETLKVCGEVTVQVGPRQVKTVRRHY